MAFLPFSIPHATKPHAMRRMAASACVASVLGVLAGCASFGPDAVPCPELKALKGYENVATTGATRGEDVTIRVNGVGTACYERGDGHRMEVDLGLLIKRVGGATSGSERVEVDVTFAFIDEAGAVVGREVISDSAIIGSNRAVSRPVLSISIDVPAGTRAVFGLGRVDQ